MTAEKTTKTKAKAKVVSPKASGTKSKETPVIRASDFAVIATGGKQYVVLSGKTLKIEKLEGEYKIGDKIVFDKVLLKDNGSETILGLPYIDGAKVEATISEIGRAPKIDVIKYKQKSRYFKKNGHRQPFFGVKILSV